VQSEPAPCRIVDLAFTTGDQTSSGAANGYGRKDVVITAPDADDTHVYVDAVRLNGRDLQQSWTGAGLTLSGGRLDFRLAQQPNTQWATDPGTLPE
jgi:putative alpha-1,2-mannosidase